MSPATHSRDRRQRRHNFDRACARPPPPVTVSAVVGELVAAGATIGLFECGVNMVRKLRIPLAGTTTPRRLITALRYAAVVVLAAGLAVALGPVPGVAVLELAAAVMVVIAATAAWHRTNSEHQGPPGRVAIAAPFLIAANTAFVVSYLTLLG